MTRICDACNEETKATLADNKGNVFCKPCFKEIYGRRSVSDPSFIKPDDDDDFGPKPRPFDPNPDITRIWTESGGNKHDFSFTISN